MKISFADALAGKEATLLCGVTKAGAHPLLSAEVMQTLKERAKFDGALYSSLSLILHEEGKSPCHVLLVGLGDKVEDSARWWRRLGQALADAARDFPAVALLPEWLLPGEKAGEKALLDLLVAYAARQYRFDKYRSKDAQPEQEMLVVGPQTPGLEKAWQPRAIVAEAVHRVKDLVCEPPNVMYPESMAARACQLKGWGVTVEVLDEQAMKTLNMGALLGVGQGSERPPRLVLLQWLGAPEKEAAPIALIGKGITFDSGGLSIKSRQNMRGMKHDMAGAAVVLETLRAAAENKLPLNVVGLLALAENMPSGHAMRPDDIVLTASGQYVEIVSTDGEGRLVMCDALWYAYDRFKPRCMVDIATLTGAMATTLGWQKAGLFSNDDALASALLAAGEESDENLWRLPMDSDYDAMLEGGDADMENATFGQMARSTFAAKYMERFVGGTPWAHIDIAGTAWSEKNTRQARKGATGFGIQLLYGFLEQASHKAG